MTMHLGTKISFCLLCFAPVAWTGCHSAVATSPAGFVRPTTASPPTKSEVRLISKTKRMVRGTLDRLIVTFGIKNEGSSNSIIARSDYRLGDMRGSLLDQAGHPVAGEGYDPLGPKVTELISTETILGPGKTLGIGQWIMNLEENTADGFSTRWEALKGIRGTTIQLNVSFNNPVAKTAECTGRKASSREPKLGNKPPSPSSRRETGILFCENLTGAFEVPLPPDRP